MICMAQTRLASWGSIACLRVLLLIVYQHHPVLDLLGSSIYAMNQTMATLKKFNYQLRTQTRTNMPNYLLRTDRGLFSEGSLSLLSSSPLLAGEPGFDTRRVQNQKSYVSVPPSRVPGSSRALWDITITGDHSSQEPSHAQIPTSKYTGIFQYFW